MKTAVLRLMAVFLCLLVLIFFLGIGSLIFKQYCVLLNGRLYARQVTSLDFNGQQVPDLNTLSELKDLEDLDLRNTGLTLGEHEWLQRQLPDCRILWQVEFQGQYYSPDQDSLTISHLKEEDLIMLDYLPELKSIDARTCRDYGPLATLVSQWPDCDIQYSVELGGKSWEPDSKELRLENAEIEQLYERLPALPDTEKALLLGSLPQPEKLLQLQKDFPDIKFSWEKKLGEFSYPGSRTELDLSCQPIENLETFIGDLSYFPQLRTLDLTGVEMEQTDMEFLENAFPQVEMTWGWEVDGVRVPLDSVILDLSGHEALTLEQIETAIKHLPRLEKLILCDCGFESEDLVKLDQKYQDVRIVWNVMVGGRNTRTDETYFAPNKWGLGMTNENIYNLRYCTDMVCVDIGHAHAVTNCEWAAFMPELRFLILADGNISDLTPLKNLKNLKFLELFLTPVKDLTPLMGCTALEDLNLCYVYADPAPVQQMTWLKRLWWSGWWQARNLLASKLPDTEKNFTTASSTGGTWRQGDLYYEMRDFIGMGYMIG